MNNVKLAGLTYGSGLSLRRRNRMEFSWKIKRSRDRKFQVVDIEGIDSSPWQTEKGPIPVGKNIRID